MATSSEYIDFVCEFLRPFGAVSARKMFGEYMAYLNGKPVLLVCDNTVYIKKYDALAPFMSDASSGFPYEGAKEHYILDVENSVLMQDVIPILEKLTPIPKIQNKKLKAKAE